MNHYTLYRPRLYLASDHPPYRREVELQLARICATQSGKLLIAAIGLGAKNVRIRPSFNGPFFPFQDVVKQSDYPDALEAAVHSYNWYEIGYGQNVMVPDALRIGTGRGAETVVEFHPAGFLEAARRRSAKSAGQTPDVVLLHELTHAMRGARGLQNNRSMYGDLSMSNYEEFCALLVENVYRSERKQKLRLSHGSRPATDAQADSDFEFYKRYAPDIDHWHDVQGDFFRAMAGVPSTFNPFRAAQLFRLKRRAAEIISPFTKAFGRR